MLLIPKFEIQPKKFYLEEREEFYHEEFCKKRNAILFVWPVIFASARNDI